MKNVILAILIGFTLAACSSAPKPKQPSEWNRVPVNKTVPTEVQGGVL